MRYIKRLPSKEGGYTRTGSRTPMQWKAGGDMGFSQADAGSFYLPVDDAADAPNVEAQERDAGSLLNTVKALLRLRHNEEDLKAKPNLEILFLAKKEQGGLILTYKRGSCVMAVNPSADLVQVPLSIKSPLRLLYSIGGCAFENGAFKLEPQSFGVWKVE
jgi:maltose alpha-D-glucosyltransferase/alpha-amylase